MLFCDDSGPLLCERSWLKPMCLCVRPLNGKTTSNFERTLNAIRTHVYLNKYLHTHSNNSESKRKQVSLLEPSSTRLEWNKVTATSNHSFGAIIIYIWLWLAMIARFDDLCVDNIHIEYMLRFTGMNWLWVMSIVAKQTLPCLDVLVYFDIITTQ